MKEAVSRQPSAVSRRPQPNVGRRSSVVGPEGTVAGREERVAPRGGRNGEAGYSLVLLAVIVTVMNIAVATALPVWSHAMQREREEELIFRGLQYAEAIRVFQNRFGRLPVRLEELIETEPRSIRQLWTDPITDSRDWGLVIATGGGGGVSVDPGRPGGDKQDPGAPPAGVGRPGGSPNLPRGPIQGVYSRSTDESIKVFLDRQRYDQWKFTLALITGQQGGAAGRPGQGQGQQNPGQRPGGGAGVRLDVRWIGRPFRPGIQPGSPGASGLPPSDLGGRAPGGRG